jgi:hypothetical protein
MKRHGAVILMVILATMAMVVHLVYGWQAFVSEAQSHGEDAAWSEYLIVWVRDTFENLQSEFWQLAVQFALLAGLFQFIGVRAYEEDTEDIKEKLDDLMLDIAELHGRIRE